LLSILGLASLQVLNWGCCKSELWAQGVLLR
jgi:hypothetical protein